MRPLKTADFYMFNGSSENASGQVDDAYQDGKPIVSAFLGGWWNRVVSR